ncbi:MAG: acetylglutamate kinase [Methanohalobium sp.]|uniref:acetylglutamate kinase n=1 Tax=Methanohalobium sp. TaxID=2837493 RepID=UPI00397AFBD2
MDLKRENVLIEALPYIQKFYDSIMVIKLGGHAMVDPGIMDDIIRDVVLLRFVGIHPVIVHGGGPEITEKMERMGKKSEFIGGLRITDDETLEIARMVLVGNINTKIVSLIGRHGGNGVGLSGKDGKMILARKKPPQKVRIKEMEHDVDFGWVGDTEIINPELIHILTEKSYIPVISPIAMDTKGNTLNINADVVASDIATSLNAEKLILLTDVTGVLRDKDDPSTRISRIKVEEVEQLIEDGVISAGMIPKIRSAASAVISGVDRVHIINGSVSHSLLLELFTDTGIGTMVYEEENSN